MGVSHAQSALVVLPTSYHLHIDVPPPIHMKSFFILLSLHLSVPRPSPPKSLASTYFSPRLPQSSPRLLELCASTGNTS